MNWTDYLSWAGILNSRFDKTDVYIFGELRPQSSCIVKCRIHRYVYAYCRQKTETHNGNHSLLAARTHRGWRWKLDLILFMLDIGFLAGFVGSERWLFCTYLFMQKLVEMDGRWIIWFLLNIRKNKWVVKTYQEFDYIRNYESRIW